MAEWSVINIDKDINGEVLGATYVMRVPGGIVLRTFLQTGSVAMVFVPYQIDDVTNTWIEDNKITK